MKVQIALIFLALTSEAHAQSPKLHEILKCKQAESGALVFTTDTPTNEEVRDAILVLDRAKALSQNRDKTVTIDNSVVDALRASGLIKDRKAKTGVMCGE